MRDGFWVFVGGYFAGLGSRCFSQRCRSIVCVRATSCNSVVVSLFLPP